MGGMTEDRNSGRWRGARVVIAAGLVAAGGLALLLIVGAGGLGVVLRDPEALDRALRQAIHECSADEVRALVQRGADPNRRAAADPQLIQPTSGGTPVQAFWRCDDPQVLQALVEGGLVLAPHLRTLAERAMRPDRRAVLAWLLRNGLSADMRWANVEGWETLVHRAARNAQPEVLEVLLQAGADPDSPDSDGQTPLMRVRAEVERLGRIRDEQPVAFPGAEARFAAVIALLQEAGGTE